MRFRTTVGTSERQLVFETGQFDCFEKFRSVHQQTFPGVRLARKVQMRRQAFLFKKYRCTKASKAK